MTSGRVYPAPARYPIKPVLSFLFRVMLFVLLFRGLFSGWDLAYDFSIPKTIKWAVDLGIYVILGSIALCRVRDPQMPTAVILALVYIATSLVFGIVYQDSGFGIEKSLSLTFINVIQFVSMVAVCAAILQGGLVVPDRLLDSLARFGMAYLALCMLVGAYLAYSVAQGGEFSVVGGRFFFVNPITLRMSATFSEPSYLGFYAGFCALLYRSRFPTRFSIVFIIFCGVVLYFLVKAKLAVIAYPLALLVGPLVRRITLKSTRILLYAAFIALFIAANVGFDEYVYGQWFVKIDDDNQQTYITRFAYIFSSLKHLAIYPLGSGFGGWIFSLPDVMAPAVDMTRGMANGELADELLTGFNFAPKDSISMAILLAGWLGVVAFVEGFLLLLRICDRRRTIGTSMVLYVLFSVAVYINALTVPIFFAVIVILIADSKAAQRNEPSRIPASPRAAELA